jgi:hypothetical protein
MGSQLKTTEVGGAGQHFFLLTALMNFEIGSSNAPPNRGMTGCYTWVGKSS